MTDIVERLRSIDISWSDEGELAAEAAVQIVGMRQEIASIKAQLDESRANDLFAMRLLAESQAREKVLRSELQNIINANWRKWDMERKPVPQDFVDWAKSRAQWALDAKTDDNALKAALANEREQCADECLVYETGLECAGALRALEDE